MKKNFMAWHRRIRKGVRLWRRTKTNSGEHGMCPFNIMTGLVRIAGKLRGDLRPNGKQQSGNGISECPQRLTWLRLLRNLFRHIQEI